MSPSEERGRWLVIASIVVFLFLDLTLMVLAWTLLGKAPRADQAMRMAVTAVVGVLLYRGYAWARWLVILASAVTVALGLAHTDMLIKVTNPFALMMLLVVCAAAAVGLLLLLSADVKAFLRSQRARRRDR